MKLILMLIALAIGFGGGVYWGVHHPVEAQKFAAEEERRFLEAQMSLTKATKEKLDQLIAAKTRSTPAGSNSFVSSAGPDPELVNLRDKTDQQMQELQQHLAQMPK